MIAVDSSIQNNMGVQNLPTQPEFDCVAVWPETPRAGDNTCTLAIQGCQSLSLVYTVPPLRLFRNFSLRLDFPASPSKSQALFLTKKSVLRSRTSCGLAFYSNSFVGAKQSAPLCDWHTERANCSSQPLAQLIWGRGL